MNEQQDTVEITARVPVAVRDIIERERAAREADSGRRVAFADVAGENLACLSVVLDAERAAARRGQTRHVDRMLSRPFAALQAAIGEWQTTTFGPGADEPIMRSMRKKLKEEYEELELALTEAGYKLTDKVLGEMADVQTVLLGIAARFEANLEGATLDKLEINKKRRWSAAAPGDVSRHIEEQEA